MGDNPPSAEDTKVCPYCGETIKRAAIVCRYCGRDLATGAPASVPAVAPAPQVVYIEKKKGGGCWRIAVAVIVMGLVATACVWWILPNPGTRRASTSSVTALATPTMTTDQLQKAARAISFDSLARNTESHVGEVMDASGTVVQVLETGDGAQLRVNLDDDFSQTVFVDYPGYKTRRVLEGDKVRMFAKVNGRVTYTTVLGAQATLPDLTALYLRVLAD